MLFGDKSIRKRACCQILFKLKENVDIDYIKQVQLGTDDMYPNLYKLL